MNNKGKNIIIWFVWGIVSIILSVIAYKVDLNLLPGTVIGSLIVGAGISTIKDSFLGWLVLDFGLAVLSYPIGSILGYDVELSNSIKWISVIGAFLIACELFLDDYIKNYGMKKRCKVPFQAKCVSFVPGNGFKYSPVYRYCIEGKVNTYLGDGKTSVNPKLGDMITIFINSKNEKEVYCPTSKAILMIRYLIGLLLVTFSTGAFIIL